MLEIMEILSVLAGKGVHVFASKGGWALDGSLQSKIRWTILGAFCGSIVVAGLITFKPSVFQTLGYFAGTLKFWEEGRVMQASSART